MTTATRPGGTLHSAATSAVSLADALRWAGLTGATALLTTPRAYHVARVDGDGRCMLPSGPCDLAGVYEARVFTPAAELRWLHEADGLGTAVLLADDPAPLPAGAERAALPVRETRAATYLLWGTASGSQDGWTTLRARRVGELTVPTDPAAPVAFGGRVALTAWEYVAVDPEHGNAYVADERLTALTPYDQEGGPGEQASP